MSISTSHITLLVFTFRLWTYSFNFFIVKCSNFYGASSHWLNEYVEQLFASLPKNFICHNKSIFNTCHKYWMPNVNLMFFYSNFYWFHIFTSTRTSYRHDDLLLPITLISNRNDPSQLIHIKSLGIFARLRFGVFCRALHYPIEYWTKRFNWRYQDENK